MKLIFMSGLAIMALFVACASESDSPGRYEGAGRQDWPSIVTVEFCQAAVRDLILTGEALLIRAEPSPSEGISALLSTQEELGAHCVDRPEAALTGLCSATAEPDPEPPAIQALFRAWRADWCWAVE